MRSPLPFEEEILDDVKAKTGLFFPILPGIPTKDKSTAEAVLPVLSDWVPRTENSNIRHALYARFGSPFAYPFLDNVVGWWIIEKEELLLGTLIQILTKLAKPQDGVRLWKLCQEYPSRPAEFVLLAKLADFPSTKDQVRDFIFQSLQNGNLDISDIQDIVKVDDARIRAWFEGQINSSNKVLRQLAKRVSERGKKLPKGLTIYSQPPQVKVKELFSTEADLEDLPEVLSSLEKKFNLKLPAWVREADFLSSVPIDQWMRALVSTTAGEKVGLWLRLEDIDTVEIIVEE